jgi:hypothetical protein
MREKRIPILAIVIALTLMGSVSVLTLQYQQQAVAQNNSMESKLMGIMGNLSFKEGIITMPIKCMTPGDVLNATFSALSGGMGTDDSNETNSTEATLMNAIKQGMDELGQGELQQLKDVLLCSPSMEK